MQIALFLPMEEIMGLNWPSLRLLFECSWSFVRMRSVHPIVVRGHPQSSPKAVFAKPLHNIRVKQSAGSALFIITQTKLAQSEEQRSGGKK